MSTRISYVPAHRLPILYRDALSPMMMRSLQARARDVGVFCKRHSSAFDRDHPSVAVPVESVKCECAMRCAATLVVAAREHVQTHNGKCTRDGAGNIID